MARGFDSKFIEAQQEEASRKKRDIGPGLTPAEQATEARRATLQLARTRAAHDLGSATAPAHRRMLEQALAALDQQLSELG